MPRAPLPFDVRPRDAGSSTRQGRRPRRVLVYGVTGSGKSTAAAHLAARLGVPYVSVDDLTWQPGWVPLPMPQQRELFAQIAAGDAWVLDGAYGGWRDLIMDRVDLVVALDYPRWLSLQRLVRRTLLRGVRKTVICNGNTEQLRRFWSSDSIVRWHFRSFGPKRRRMRSWAAAPSGPPVLLVRRPRDLARWIATLPPPPPDAPPRPSHRPGDAGSDAQAC